MPVLIKLKNGSTVFHINANHITGFYNAVDCTIVCLSKFHDISMPSLKNRIIVDNKPEEISKLISEAIFNARREEIVL